MRNKVKNLISATLLSRYIYTYVQTKNAKGIIE